MLFRKLKKIKLENCQSIIGNKNLKDLFIKNGTVVNKELTTGNAFEKLDCLNCIVAPGFVDPQVNGLEDCNFWDLPSFKQIDDLRIKLAKGGTIAFCPTIVTAKKEDILNSIENINLYLKQADKESGALILGIHIEGVFITKYGIHNEQFVQKELTPKTIEPYLKDNVAIFTLAPELDKTGETIKLLHKNNILISIGHSNATFREGEFAIKEYGIKAVTHMFNSLRGIEHFSHRGESNSNLEILKDKLTNKTKINPDRDGIMLAILSNNDVSCSVIADGNHVKSDVVNFLYKIKGKNYFSLTTDMVAYDILKLGMQKGTLSGGQLSLKDCVSNLARWNITDIEDALTLASKPITNILKVAKNYSLGEIQYGKRAYITIWDTVKQTIRGTIIGENLFLNY